MVPTTVPRGLGLAARLVMESVVGRVKVPSPIAARINANSARNHTMPFAWNQSYPARVGVMPREGGNADVRWFDVEPCYVFHPLNAYTEDRDGTEVLVLDVVRHGRMFEHDRRGPGEGHPTLDRWEIDLSTGAVRQEQRDGRQQEFPRINETLTGARHRYGYTVGIDGGFASAGDMRTGVFKHDYDLGSAVAAPLDDELWVGEMSFVANPGALAEDDGVLMGYGYHRGRDEGQLLILDAASLETIATVHVPQRIPMGFHGNWAPAAGE
jgi:carotenoid cleavage dioxygenase